VLLMVVVLWIENMCVGLRRKDVSIGRSVGSGCWKQGNFLN
jgi:hypothetical protein